MSQGFTKGTPIDTDPTLSLNSDIVVPSQAAVVAYVASQVGAGSVTNVTASAPILSSGGATPNISIPVATSLVDGYLSAADWITFNGKQNNVGFTTVGNNLATLANPSAITYIRINADNTVTTRTPAQVLTDLGVAGTIILNRNFADTAAITGTTVNTLVFAVLIPANTLQANDWITFRVFVKSNTAGTNLTVYLNTTPAVPVVSPITIGNLTLAANNGGLYERNFMIPSIGPTGSVKYFQGTQLSAYSPANFNAASATINTTVDQYLVLSTQNSTVGTSFVTNGNLITILR
jgi:hypothetical protein